MENNLVFHYCSVATALSILNSREIWMTSIRNMNDANESVGVYRMFFDLLQKVDAKGKLSSMLQIAKVPGAIQAYENPLGAYPEYVTCFSENSDLVSQWIAYGDNGRGIAIGFDKGQITNLASQMKEVLHYQNISYVSEGDIQQYIPSIYENLVGNQCDNEGEMMRMAMEHIRKIYPRGIDYKTMHYSSESEVRLIYRYGLTSKKAWTLGEWKFSELKAYAKENMINTYVSMHFPDCAVKKIVLGPRYQKNYFETEVALEALNYTGIDVAQSNSGYR